MAMLIIFQSKNQIYTVSIHERVIKSFLIVYDTEFYCKAKTLDSQHRHV